MKLLKKLNTLFVLALLLTTVGLSSTHAFSDINSGSKYFVEINYLKDLGIIQGYEDNTYKSKQEINRAEALKLFLESSNLLRAEEMEALEMEYAPFSDTPLDAWYTPYLYVARERGIISGYPDGTFKPEQPINLVETLKIYLECHDGIVYPEEHKNRFQDIDEQAWYGKYVRYADSKDMLEIFNSYHIKPTRNQNRGDIAGLIYRHIKHNEGNMEFGKATFYGKAVQGRKTASGEVFDYHKATAAHKTLPFGSIVKVTNLANGKTVEVRITDRGPYGPGRIIDLTESAFSEIAWLGTGVIHVQMEVLSIPEKN